MSDYDRLIDYKTYDLDLIRHKRPVKGVISNGICTVLTTDIAPFILLISCAFKSPCLANKEQITS